MNTSGKENLHQTCGISEQALFLLACARSFSLTWSSGKRYAHWLGIHEMREEEKEHQNVRTQNLSSYKVLLLFGAFVLSAKLAGCVASVFTFHEK